MPRFRPLANTAPCSDEQSNLSPTAAVPSARDAPVVVGIHGLPGSGKTFLLNRLKQELGEKDFAFFEGSEVISSLVNGGLNVFHALTEPFKALWRQRAIDWIREDCITSGKLGIVTGNFMFWSEHETMPQPILTPQHWNIYTHILYLDVSAELIARRRRDDARIIRPPISIAHLEKWQDTEKSELRKLCLSHDVLFSVLSSQTTLVDRASALIRDFRHHTEAYNISRSEIKLDEALGAQKNLQTMLVLDASTILTVKDTGEPLRRNVSPFKEIFGVSLGYSYTASRQAVLVREDIADESRFDAICTAFASSVEIRPEFLSLLRAMTREDHVGALVVTCGLRRIWEKILEMHGLSGVIKVIGGGRIADGYVVTAEIKARLVSRLRNVHGLYVVAFGDSPLDLPMLSAADQAVIVVSEENTKSKSMDTALRKAIELEGLRASQVLLPSNAVPRLSIADLPLIRIDGPEFINSVCRRRRNGLGAGSRVLHATGEIVAKLLMTPMLDANSTGPTLRESHRRIGLFLATRFLTELVGLEEYTITDVNGHQTAGFRLRDEQYTLIIPLSWDGEHMAYGVNDVLPSAMFVHAKGPNNVKEHHLAEKQTVILVDSAVNSGKTVAQFVQRIRTIRSGVRIVVITGVVQSQSLSQGSLAHALAHDSSLYIITLRLSDNMFTSSGTTDTDN
ncbi:uracil phosphoribosyltransferase-domain-containing protein [Nemania sp. NC0429]|nr:uracil phosphoribosyltransferase-domain-containing protein [Nemania sp. NC0429]